MKILQICSARQFGGGERHVADLSNSLADTGYEVYAAINPGSPLDKNLVSLPRVNIREVRMRNSIDILAGRELASIVRDLNIDIIHAHVARDYPLAAYASARTGNTPFILTRHVLFPINKIHRRILARASRIIAVSNGVRRSLIAQKILAPERIVTIYNGVDTGRFETALGPKTAASADKKDRLLVGMIGHIASIKGQEDFIRAAAIIVRQRPDVDFVIVGEDKSRRGENREAVEDLVAKLNGEKRIRFAGWREDVRQILGDLDVFVSPSRSEPFGLVIIEAMTAGIPVVTTASEGALEIIDDGKTGKIVPIRDPESLADSIVSLLDDPAERSRIAAAALKIIRQRFSLERMVVATGNLYAEVISERS